MTTATTVLAASLAPAHPALRWTPIDAEPRLQHARENGERTACGRVGHLTLAESTDAFCGDCFPGRSAGQT